MNTPMIVSLVAYFLLMMAIGVYGFFKSTANVSEYMLGGRKLHPAVGALSAGASDMSGWMLMGLPGAVYLSGLGAAWIAVGLVIGAYFNYLLVAPRLRVYTEEADDAITIPDYFEKRFQDNSHSLRIFASLVIVVFFTLYTSAGVVAGGKLFEAAFGLQYQLGLIITASVVVAYTMFGGFLAVSLTDFVQGCIMFVALILVPWITWMELGNLDQSALEFDPDYVSWFSGVTALGLISSLSWGLGYFGQPHIIVRFMAIRSLADMSTARRIGMSWMIITVIGAVLTGLFGFLYVSQTATNLEDPETVFILLSQVLFNPYLSGFLLAAILAAIMSTISSQLLVSSSSLTEDLYKNFFRKQASQSELVTVGRLSVLGVSVIATLLALDSNSSILSLVSNAWAGFGAAFGPVILLSLYWGGLTRNGALASMVSGAATVLIWIYGPFTFNGAPLSATIYEIIPGFIVAFAAALVVSKLDSQPNEVIRGRHQRISALLQN
ncbi:MAG: sodium/proline symporter PutP [Pseudohongiellaceae bacterium]